MANSGSLSYTDLLNQFGRNTGQADQNGNFNGTAAVKADFQANLGQRYQLVLAKLTGTYKTQQQFTASTVANQIYYGYPPGTVDTESVTVTVGSVTFPLDIINSQRNWDTLHAIQIQASALPQFIFPRKDDFGIWPTPQAVYTITFNQHMRDRNLLVDDYTGGTALFTSGSPTVTGTSTTWTSAMVGRWIMVTDTTVPGEGFWYRIQAVNSTTSLTLDSDWANTTMGAAATYRIAQLPEIPEEGHILLADGTTADFYSGMQKDIDSATWFNNKFYTGDGTNPNRDFGNPQITAGLIGLAGRYENRTNKHIINRRPQLNPLVTKFWATTLS